jgi:hypothetical protein
MRNGSGPGMDFPDLHQWSPVAGVRGYGQKYAFTHFKEKD